MLAEWGTPISTSTRSGCIEKVGGEAADRIHELFQAGKRAEAIEAVPDEYMDEGGLFGPVERIRERWRDQWEKMPYTGLTVRAEQEEAFDLMAELAGTRETAR